MDLFLFAKSLGLWMLDKESGVDLDVLVLTLVLGLFQFFPFFKKEGKFQSPLLLLVSSPI